MKSIILLVLSLSSVLAWSKAPQILALGAKAPDFSLPGVDGKTYSLASFSEAKALVVIFTCNHCPDAIPARPRVQQLVDDYSSKGVSVVAISGNDPEALQPWELGWSVYGDSFDEMKLLYEEEKFTYPYLYDGETQAATLAYGAQATPHVFIFDHDRILQYQGQLDDGRRGAPKTFAARDALDEILAGKPVTTQTTRIFGCSTKWSWKREVAQKKEEEWKALPVVLETIDVEGVKALAKNDGQRHRLINVWATDCGPCVAEFPELIETYRRFEHQGFEVVTISMDGESRHSAVLKFLEGQHAALVGKNAETVAAEGRKTNNYHFVGDDANAFAEALDPKWQGPLPHSFLIAPGGEVIWRHTGGVDIIDLRRAVVKALVD